MKTEEISLIDLVKTGIIDSVKFIIKWQKVFYFSVLFGIVIASLFFWVKRTTYEAKILAISPSGHYYEATEQIKTINDLKTNTNILADKLELNFEDAQNLIKVEADTLEKRYISIELVYKDTIDLKAVEQGIINFVEKSDYISKQIALSIDENEKTKAELELEIKELDSLQTIIMRNLQNESSWQKTNSFVFNNKEVQFFQDDILSRKKEVYRIERYLQRIKGLDIIKPFSPVKIKKYSTIIIFIVSIFLSILLGIIWSIGLVMKEIIAHSHE